MRKVKAVHTKHQWTERVESALRRGSELAVVLCLLCLVPTAFAQTLTQTEIQKLLASDSDSSSFGQSVSISGDRALIGAGYNGTGVFSGSAYVYERDVEGTWLQVARLFPSDGTDFNRFDNSVSLSGDRALVGANRDSDAGFSSGSAYIFELDGARTWVEVAKLTASGATSKDMFGGSVSLSGNRALVGADRDHGGSPGAVLTDSGSAYLFERDGTGS